MRVYFGFSVEKSFVLYLFSVCACTPVYVCVCVSECAVILLSKKSYPNPHVVKCELDLFKCFTALEEKKNFFIFSISRGIETSMEISGNGFHVYRNDCMHRVYITNALQIYVCASVCMHAWI